MDFPRTLFSQDHQLFRESFRSFLSQEVEPFQEEWEEQGIVPREIWLKAGELGFLVTQADEKYGGLGLNDWCYDAVMLEELGRINDSGFFLPLHNCIVSPYILTYGTEEQKKRLIPKMVSGEIILAIAMTEPGTGSDLAGMKTTAVDCGDHWLLNGQKTFISNGILSDLVIVAAKTDVHHPHAMGLFMIERDDPGFERGRCLKKLGLHAQDTSELYFHNVKVPKENVLGNPLHGFQYLTEKLATERLSLAISSLATARAALEGTTKYVKQRKAFGKPIGSFQNTKFKLAELKTEVEIGQVYIDRMIQALNEGNLTGEQACGGKYWATELACRVVDECLQLHGGYGYMMEYPICKMFANVRVGKIYAGTNEIMKMVIAKGMGL